MRISTVLSPSAVALRSASFAHPHLHAVANPATDRTWKATTKFANYANFYAVDEALGASIG